jgi:hypothetical protein
MVTLQLHEPKTTSSEREIQIITKYLKNDAGFTCFLKIAMAGMSPFSLWLI